MAQTHAQLGPADIFWQASSTEGAASIVRSSPDGWYLRINADSPLAQKCEALNVLYAHDVIAQQVGTPSIFPRLQDAREFLSTLAPDVSFQRLQIYPILGTPHPLLFATRCHLTQWYTWSDIDVTNPSSGANEYNQHFIHLFPTARHLLEEIDKWCDASPKSEPLLVTH